jgi:protein-S-isoprenylcysteine O-methyltransferase Ste14
VQSALHTLGWLACVVYSTIPAFWLLIHTRIEYWRSRPNSPYRVLIPVWAGMWVLVALLTLPWRTAPLYQNPWTWLPAAALFAVGIWIYSRAGAGFSPKQLGGMPEVQGGHPEQRLVTAGIRAHVRHPVYLAHLCEMLAWSIGTGLAVCYGLTAFAAITGAIMIHREDSELRQRFGEPCRAYQNSVPAVLPKLGPTSSRL